MNQTRLGRVELTIDANYDAFGENDESRIVAAIRELLALDSEITVIQRRRGSVKLTLELPDLFIEKLVNAVSAGQLRDLGVIHAQRSPLMDNNADGVPRFRWDVFLSHSSKDKEIVRELGERLRADGFLVWFDDWSIGFGDSIPLAIEKGLQHSRVLAFFMSKHAFASEWADLERHTALFRDPSNSERRFIPIRLDDAPIPNLLSHFRYID